MRSSRSLSLSLSLFLFFSRNNTFVRSFVSSVHEFTTRQSWRVLRSKHDSSGSRCDSYRTTMSSPLFVLATRHSCHSVYPFLLSLLHPLISSSLSPSLSFRLPPIVSIRVSLSSSRAHEHIRATDVYTPVLPPPSPPLGLSRATGERTCAILSSSETLRITTWKPNPLFARAGFEPIFLPIFD